MAAFPKLVLTNAGISLQTKVQGGATLELTNIQMGSGQLNGQPIGPLTALISSNVTVPIQSGQAIGQNTYQVEGFFTNADLSVGFWWREIGIFANDPDDGEILYAYANAGDAGDYIPTVTDQRIEKYIYFSMALANATTVTVTIPQTDTYVLQSTVGQANGVAGLDENGTVPIKQGGTGATTVQSALLNLNAAASTLGQVMESDLLAWADKQTISGAFGINPSVTTEGVPAVGWYHGFLEVKTSGMRITLTESSGNYRTWTNCTSSGQWTKWTPQAIATPPEVRNLTLQSGFAADGDCTFFVTQESVAFLAGGASGTLSANQDTQIGTLPADARPSAQRRRPAVTNNGPAYIDIHADGTVWAHPFAAASQCWFDCSFVAGGA